MGYVGIVGGGQIGMYHGVCGYEARELGVREGSWDIATASNWAFLPKK